MATFSVRFLGCKVSHTDSQAIREALLRDGHAEARDRADVAVVNTCCVTHEAVSKSRQAVSRAARTAKAVYVTGCASRLEGAFDGAARNVVVAGRTGDEAAAFVAGDVGEAAHRLALEPCRTGAPDRLRPGRQPARARDVPRGRGGGSAACW